MISAILFDLDDTLFDHHHASIAALARVHEEAALGGTVDFDAFAAKHAHFLEELHLEVLAGRIPLDEARRERFRRVFEALGVRATPEIASLAALAYRRGYLAARRAVPGARELLAALRPRVRIGIVSNNLLDEQREKIVVCGLADLVDVLLVSEEAGISKPDPAIFRMALERLGARADETVMVGDSWRADVQGALRAGIACVWFNRTGAPRPTDAPIAGELSAWLPMDDVVQTLLAIEPRAAAPAPRR